MKIKLPYSILCLSFVTLLLYSCDKLLPSSIADENLLDGSISTLTTEELSRHITGDEEFGRVFSQNDGLGPIFNAASCESCHIGDGRGHSLTTFIRFGRMLNGKFDPMYEFGGPQLQNRALPGYAEEILPNGVTGVSKFLPPPVTGLGFVEAVDDSVFINLSDPDDKNGDGISGRLHYVISPTFFTPNARHHSKDFKYIARFGRKAMAIDLLHQTVNAYFNDVGLSTDFHPIDIINVQSGKQNSDKATDPEVNSRIVNDVVFYLQTLKAPQRRNTSDADVIAGEIKFNEIGCASCHTTTLKTAKSNISSLSEVEFHPYSDFLLHDMGAELDDGYTEGDATTSEWRTTPLWGIGLADISSGGNLFFLHDGRAKTLEDAINYHGGESARIRDVFKALSVTTQQQVIKFLRSL